MKFFIFFATQILGLFTVTVSAQKVTYQYLDSVTSAICKMQSDVNGYMSIYNDYKVSFPSASFKINTSNHLATKAVYREFKSDGGEVLFYTEDTDFSTAQGIIVIPMENKKIRQIEVSFPSGTLKAKKVTVNTGVVLPIKDAYVCTFYCLNKYDKSSKSFLFDQMFFYLVDLCNNLKLEKGLITSEQIAAEKADWVALSADQFIQQHPKSILAAQARLNLSEMIYKKEEQIKKAKEEFKLVNDYFTQLCNKYQFVPDIKVQDMAAINAEIRNMYTKNNSLGPYKYGNGSSRIFRYGIEKIVLNSDDKIIKLETRISYSKSNNYLKAYASSLADIKSKIPDKYINETTCNYDACIILSHPDINYTIKFIYYNPPKRISYLEDIIFEMK